LGFLSDLHGILIHFGSPVTGPAPENACSLLEGTPS